MTLTDAILVATGTFVAVLIALSIIARVAFGKNAEKLVALREQQQKSLELSRSQVQDERKRSDLRWQRADEFHQRSVDLQTRAERSSERSEKNQDRWEQALSRIEALVERLEKRTGA